MIAALKVILVILCALLITIILLQSGRSAGLSGVITGGGDQSLGRRGKGLDSFLAKVTVGVAALFFVVALVIEYLVVHNG